jgi:O-antigen ligase
MTRGQALTAALILVSGLIVLAGILSLQQPLYGFAGVGVLGAALLCMRYPGLVFAAYLYIPFYKGSIESITPVDITPVLAAGCFLQVLPILWQGTSLAAIRTAGLWFGFMAVITAGTMYSPQLSDALEQFVLFGLLVFLPCLLAMRIASSERLIKQFLVSTLALALLLLALGIVGLATGVAGARLTIAGANTIGSARALLFTPLLAVYLWRTVKLPTKTLLLFASPLALFASLATGSRGPVAVFFVTLMVMQIFDRRHILRNSVTGIGLLLVAICAFQIEVVQGLLPEQAVRRIMTLVNAAIGNGELDSSSSARVQLWQLAIDMFGERALIGHGTASFGHAAFLSSTSRGHEYPHNLLLHLAAEFGFFGLFLFGLLVLYAFRGVLASELPSWHLAVLALLTYALFNAMISNGIYENRWLWGMLVMAGAIPIRRASTNVQAAGSTTFGSTDQCSGCVRGEVTRPINHHEPTSVERRTPVSVF